MTFDPTKHLIKVQGGRDYLPVAARLVWLHEDAYYPTIETELVRINEQEAIVRAVVTIPARDDLPAQTFSGYGRELNDGKFPYVEKAETSAIGRALAHAGYGTLNAGLDDEQIVDSPRQAQQPAKAPANRTEPIPEPAEANRIIRDRLAKAELRDMGGIKLDIKQWGMDTDMEILAAYNARNHVLKGGIGGTMTRGQRELTTVE